MTVTCSSCGQASQRHDFCDFCNMPLGLHGHIASKEVLPRLKAARSPASLDEEEIPVVLPAPPRTLPAAKAAPPRRREPAKSSTKRWLWLLAFGGFLGLVVVVVVVAGVVSQLGGGSLFGLRAASDPATKALDERKSADQLARERLASMSLPNATLLKMLEVAQPKNTDVVIDLGCADGRLAVLAAETYGIGVRAWDNDRGWVKLARRWAEENGRQHLIEVQHTDDVLGVDLRQGTIIMLVKPERFGSVNEVARRLESQLVELKAGVRIVSTQPICRPHEKIELPPDGHGRVTTIYLAKTPLR